MSQPNDKPHADDLTNREAAAHWLGHRIRLIGKIAVLGIVLTPVAVTIVLVGKVLIRAKTLPPMDVLLPAVGLWSAIVIPILLFVAALIGFKRLRIARRVKPVVLEGAEQHGRVVDVLKSDRRAGGVTHYKVTVVVQTESGAQVQAAIEEMEGGELPEVPTDAPATVWTLGDTTVVGTSGSLFEAGV